MLYKERNLIFFTLDKKEKSYLGHSNLNYYSEILLSSLFIFPFFDYYKGKQYNNIVYYNTTT